MLLYRKIGGSHTCSMSVCCPRSVLSSVLHEDLLAAMEHMECGRLPTRLSSACCASLQVITQWI